MSHLVSFPRLDRVTPPLEEIICIWATLCPVDRDYIYAFMGDIPLLATKNVDWNFVEVALAFWNPKHAVFNIQGAKLTLTIEEYQTLISRTAATRGIVEPNLYTSRPTLVSYLLGVKTTRLDVELAYFGSTEIAIEKILSFIQSRVHKTLLFLHSLGLNDAALVGVILQVFEGRRFEIALMAETIRSVDRVTRTHDRKMRGSPILLQFWLQSHARPFGLVRPVHHVFSGASSEATRGPTGGSRGHSKRQVRAYLEGGPDVRRSSASHRPLGCKMPPTHRTKLAQNRVDCWPSRVSFCIRCFQPLRVTWSHHDPSTPFTHVPMLSRSREIPCKPASFGPARHFSPTAQSGLFFRLKSGLGRPSRSGKTKRALSFTSKGGGRELPWPFRAKGGLLLPDLSCFPCFYVFPHP
ncbi:hypothetical protein CRG98_001102 [Punica granatum]|uniref:Aminotransferase-like plant mobile domain-containing protein n=1 Tax=Punica granatum TaxID=22663 RepID=A0A2I0LCQ6_PUNGR|nr:hypothetical protein CRG98_001102 [Punica granatum]